jgi:hypothetical protein
LQPEKQPADSLAEMPVLTIETVKLTI